MSGDQCATQPVNHKDEGAGGVPAGRPHSAVAFLAVTTAAQRHVTHFPVYHWTIGHAIG